MSLLTFFRNLYMKWVGIQNPPLTANCKKQFTVFAIWGMSTVIPFCFLQWFRVFPGPQPNDLGFCQWTSWQHAIHMTSKGGSMDCHAVTSQDDFIVMLVIVFIVSLSFFSKRDFWFFCSWTCGLLLWYQLEACHWVLVLPWVCSSLTRREKSNCTQCFLVISKNCDCFPEEWNQDESMTKCKFVSKWLCEQSSDKLQASHSTLVEWMVNSAEFSLVMKGEASFRLLLDWREGHYSCILFDFFILSF